MQQVSFSFPTLATAQMPTQDQINATVNQAAAVIICSYLEHLNKLTEVLTPATQSSASLSVVSPAELVTLINDVQAALRGV